MDRSRLPSNRREAPPEPPPPDTGTDWRIRGHALLTPGRVAALSFAFALALYLVTLAPGLFWGDSAQLQSATAHPHLGVGVRAYPLWTVLSAGLARVTTLPAPLSANLFCALCGAAAVGLAFFYTFKVSGSLLAGGAAAAVLAVSHLLWSSSVAAEVYTLAADLLFVQLLAALKAEEPGWSGPLLFGFVAGVGLLHHRMLQLAAAAIFVPLAVEWVRQHRLVRSVLYCSAGFALGAVPFAVLLAATAGNHGILHELHEVFLGSFSLSPPKAVGMDRGLLGILLYELRFVVFELAGPQLLLAAVGFAFAWRTIRGSASHLTALVVVSLLLPLLFAGVGDRYVLLLPAVCAAAVAAGLGAAAARSILRARQAAAIVLLCAACPPIVYGGLAVALSTRRLGLFSGAAPRHVRTFVWPGKRGNRDARNFGENVYAAVPDGSAVLTGWGDGEVLAYMLANGVPHRRIDLVKNWRPEDLVRCMRPEANRPVFVSSYPYLPMKKPVPAGFRLEPVVPDALWRVRRKQRR